VGVYGPCQPHTRVPAAAAARRPRKCGHHHSGSAARGFAPAQSLHPTAERRSRFTRALLASRLARFFVRTEIFWWGALVTVVAPARGSGAIEGLRVGGRETLHFLQAAQTPAPSRRVGLGADGLFSLASPISRAELARWRRRKWEERCAKPARKRRSWSASLAASSARSASSSARLL